MSLALFVYLASISNGIVTLSIVLAVTAVWLSVYSSIWVASSYIVSEKEKYSMLFKKSILAACVFSVVSILTPSEKTIYTMGAAYAAEKTFQSEIAQDTIKLLHGKIKEQLKDMEPSKK